MFKHLEGARLGIFIFVATVFLVVSIFLIGNKESLFVDTIMVKTYFPGIEGLRNGAPVRLSGYDIGSVSNIQLADDTTGRVEVEMRIDKEVVHFVRLDSKASIETEGLVGKKIVTITPGSPDNEVISNGGFILAKPPVSMAEIISETQAVMAYMKDITKDFSEIVAKINTGEGTIGKLIKDDRLYESTVSITQSADKSLTAITARVGEVSDFLIEISGGFESIVNNVDSAVVDVKKLIATISRGEGTIGSLIYDRSVLDSVKTVIANLVQTTEEAKLGTSKFAENMEALKYNWLFKSYFEQRGYWDKAEYEKEIDAKLIRIKAQNELLDQKIQELIDTEERLKRLQYEQ